MDFEELLKQNHMGYTAATDEDIRGGMRSFWMDVMTDRGQNVSDAEIDSVLLTYQELGFIADLDDPAIHVNPYKKKVEEAQKKEKEIREIKEVKEEKKVEATVIKEEKKKEKRVSDWTLLISYEDHPTGKSPMLRLEGEEDVPHHIDGAFTNPERSDAFEYHDEAGRLHTLTATAIDKRFVRFIHWLGTNHVFIRLLGEMNEGKYNVMRITAADPNGNEALTSANNSFLQLVMKRLWASCPPKEIIEDDPEERSEEDEAVILSDMASMIDFMKTAGDTLPPAIKAWAYRNIAMTKSGTISQEEQRHAQRALSMMLRIQWQSSFFPSIDPVRAREILDEELYGMNEVKQRVIETIIQINRTHTLPGYGLLLVGPAGTGKSQIAYAVARILKLPWTSLDMSTIHDAEALTGSPRVYTNAKPGRIMEAFAEARSSNLVFIINELDKADAGSSLSNPADTLLTLLDGLGFTDNYIECTIPTSGVYPIATANDISRISDPLLTRFALIEIPDYTAEERKIIFRDYSMPRVFRKMGMKEGECIVTDDGIDAVVERYIDQPGVRSLEQAAEHIAANTLYQIETRGVASVTFDRMMIRKLLG